MSRPRGRYTSSVTKTQVIAVEKARPVDTTTAKYLNWELLEEVEYLCNSMNADMYPSTLATLVMRLAHAFASACWCAGHESAISALVPPWIGWMAMNTQIMNRIAKTRSDKNINLEISCVQASPRTTAIKEMAPPAMNGLRLPQEELQWSLQSPKQGWMKIPQMGPEANVAAAWERLTPNELRCDYIQN